MKVVLTKDYVNGEHSKATEPLYLDEIDTFTLKMMLASKGVCGLTITKSDMLREMKKANLQSIAKGD